MARISIPVDTLEFDEDGQTIWVHSPKYATVLRIKTLGKIEVKHCDSNPVSHSDILVRDNITICLSDDAKKG